VEGGGWLICYRHGVHVTSARARSTAATNAGARAVSGAIGHTVRTTCSTMLAREFGSSA
jgi:hypothetical protein